MSIAMKQDIKRWTAKRKSALVLESSRAKQPLPKPLVHMIYPLLRSDNGLIFTSRRYTALVRSYRLQQEFITSHCSQQNSMVERISYY